MTILCKTYECNHHSYIYLPNTKGLVTNYRDGGGGGHVKFYPFEKGGWWKKFQPCKKFPLYKIVGSVKVNFLSYRYRADKSTIFGMRGLWGLTINSGRGATLKYL